MKERPILFSGDMVRALLDGRKTQTRRAIKPQPASGAHWQQIVVDGHGGWVDGHGAPLSCPYGQPGDRLWVRETWSHTGQGVWRVRDVELALDGNLIYRASNDAAGVGWFPSIHMPRWASRILLEVTAVRVERLQEISEGDARAEGIGDHRFECDRPVELDGYPACSCGSVGYVDAFSELWSSINGDGSWDANSWVWVVEFRVIEPREVAA